MKTNLMLGAVAALILTGATGVAAERGGGGPTDGPGANRGRMKRFMENHPGIRARLKERFDADGDGKLSDDERAQAREALKERFGERRERLLEKFDADGDGKLSEEERTQAREAIQERLGERREKLLEKFDADGDGKLGEGERAEAREHVRKGLGEKRGEGRGRGRELDF